jgi:pyruvate dehydrogenase E1 component
VGGAKDAGQHVELGIAENNLFLMLAAAGLSGDLFGHRLFPIGTLYDPFIARGLDSLNYACYQDARFLLVATPSGLTLGPEGGAHQSINPPLIALGQPGLRHYEPAFADELALFMGEAFRLIDDPAGESHLPPPLHPQHPQEPERTSDDWQADALAGGYWLREPGPVPKPRSSPWARSCPKRSPPLTSSRTTSPASACSASPAPTSSTAAGARRRPPLAGERKPSHVEPSSPACRPAPPRHPLRRRACLPLLARRRPRPPRRAARRRPLRPDRQPPRPLRRIPPRRRSDHRSDGGLLLP